MIQWSGQMRGFAMSQTSFVELLIGNGIGRNARLEKIAQLLDWSRLQTLVEQVRPGDTGRPPYPPLAMFKALLLQQWYGLSDPGLEEALLDRVSFRRFCGLSLEGATPDETTLCRFRNDLKASGLGEPLFAEVSRQFEAAGLTLRSGTLIDATLVESAVRSPAPGTTAKGEESRSPHDGDANWTRQGQSRRLFFGYKVHVGVDLGSGLIRSRLVTPAKTYESEVADQLIIGDEAAVYAGEHGKVSVPRRLLFRHPTHPAPGVNRGKSPVPRAPQVPVFTAELTVHEPDDGVVHFAQWRPFGQDAVCRASGSAPAREVGW